MKGPRGLVAIGTFHLRGGPGTVELWSAVSLADYPTITVTREPEDGNPASSGQVVLTNHTGAGTVALAQPASARASSP
jgi:hypothetical protein